MKLNEQQNLLQRINHLERVLNLTQRVTNLSYWEYDFSSKKLRLSDELCVMLGIDNNMQALSLEKYHEYIHKNDRPSAKQAFEQILKSKKSYEIIYRVDLKNGKGRYVKENCIASLDEYGNLSLLTAIVQNITGAQKYEKQLQIEKEFNDAIINATPGILCLFSKSGELLKWNRNLEILSGLTSAEISQKMPVDFMPDRYDQKFQQAMKTAFQKGDVLVEAEFKDKSGEEIPYLFNGKRIKRNSEWLLLAIGIDISKRKEAEKGREKILEDLHERMKELTCLFKINELFRTKTQNLGEILELAAETIPPGWLHPDHTSAEIMVDNITARSKEFQKSDHFLTEKIITDSTERGYIKVFIAAPDESKNYFLKEEKSLLRQIAINLSQLIHKLESEKILQRKNRLLEESNVSKNLLISIISHDLRGPMNSIISLLDIIETEFESIDEETLKGYLRAIQSSAINTKDLMENLLEWALVQSKKQKVEPSILDASKLVEENKKPLIPQADSKGIQISVQIKRGLQVFADKKMMGTVIRNLLSNALKFTPKYGTVRITGEEKGNFAVFKIEDDGTGINADILKTLFNLEKTVSSPGTEKEPGSGFGLILCKEFVEKNRGNITIKSAERKGTTASFTLPLSGKIKTKKLNH